MMGPLSELHFIRPGWLFALALLVPLVWMGIRRQRSAGAWRKVCDAHLLPHVITQGGGRARHWPLALAAAGWLATCLALAGPTWERLPQPAYRTPAQRVFVLNLSRSMDARDVEPSRLARAKFELVDALGALDDGQAGLVIFAEEPYVVTPLSDDPKVVASFLPVLETNLMPGRGARLDRAIDEARGLLEQAAASTGGIVVVTDGVGDQPLKAVEAARTASRAGIPVSVLGVGTRAGGGAGSLEALADAGGGRFAASSPGDDDIAAVLRLPGVGFESDGQLAETQHTADVWRDMGIALVWLVALMAPLAFRRGWATALALALVVGASGLTAAPAEAGVNEWMWRPDQLGAEAFEEGRHEAAAELFEDPAWRAASLYRNGHFEEAAAILDAGETLDDRYNLGNALANAGQLEQAIAAYDEVLARDPEHEDAQHNRDLVAKLLEEQKQSQRQQQSQDGSPSDASDDSGQSQANAAGAGSDASASTESEPGSSDEAGDSDAQPSSASDPTDDASGARSGSDSEAGSGSEPGSDPADAAGGDASEELAESEQRDAAGTSAGDPANQEAARDAASSPPQTASETSQSESEPGASGSARHGAESPAGGASASAGGSGEPTDLAADTAPSGPAGSASSMASQPLSEREQAVEQWLSRVSDDPGGLLREKLRRRYAQKRYLETMGGRIR